MVRKMYAVYDSKAGAFCTPFFAGTPGLAARSFAAACADPSNDISRFSDDFTLFYLGEFEDTDGTFKLLEVREQVAWATQIKVALQAQADTKGGQ